MRKIEIFDTPDSLFEAAASRILEVCESCIKEKGMFTIALSGGNTPKRLYQLLSHPAYSAKVDWKRVFVFWSDERIVPVSEKENNSNMASEALLNNVPIPKENIFRVPVHLEPKRAALLYEQMIRDILPGLVPRLDLVLLGLGEDGHTASLFPGTEILEEKKALVKEVFIKNKNTYRISFTTTLINQAKQIVFLVAGIEKSIIVAKLFNKPVKRNVFPVQLIKSNQGNLYWFIDKQAASKLIF